MRSKASINAQSTLAFAILMSFVMAFSIVQCVVGLWNETFTVVTGFIYTITSDDATFLIGMVLGHGVPFVITLMVTPYMTYRIKMLRDPVSALMTSAAASFMILSIPLNLLVGLSVIIDQPAIGSCNIRFLLVTKAGVT